MKPIGFLFAAAACLVSAADAGAQLRVADGDWPCHGRTPLGTRHSPLDEINRGNVSRLERAWTLRTGDISPTGHVFECTPLVVDCVMYIITPFSRALAVNAQTGGVIWSHDPGMEYRREGALASRGLAYWEGPDGPRIILPVRDGRLILLDAETGAPDARFGDGGTVNLRERLAPAGKDLFISSPPSVYGDILVQGCGMPDGYGSRLGHVPVIAIHLPGGETAWTFNTIPQGNEPGRDTWEGESWRDRGAANVWSLASVDPARGIVYLPTTSPSFDFYGGDRKGDNLYSNSVVALDAASGEMLWHFQCVRHDLWDYDLPAQPNLVDLTIDGQTVPAVAQVGKTGFVYVLNRITGKPLFPVEYRPVPASDVPGEEASPVQPFPLKPPPISRQGMMEEDLSRLSPETRAAVSQKFRELRSEGLFTPPSERGTVQHPGFHGGGNWSGAAVSPDGMMYVNTTELPGIITVEKDEKGPYGWRHLGWERFRDPEGYPAIAPPWGELVKVDLNLGEIVWRKPLGEFEELTARGIPVTGQENFGGATVTAGGLVFIASTMDERIRAFDAETGEILFEHPMEAAGYAAPVSYLGTDGRQYIAICAGGGGKLGTPHGDYVIAFALPRPPGGGR